MKSKWFERFLRRYDDMPKSFRKGKYVFCYAMIIVAVLNFIVFYIGINFNSIIMAFQRFVGFDDNFNEVYEWGFGNFQAMFKEFSAPNSHIGIAIKNTLRYFCCSTFLVLPISYFVSYFLFKKVKGYGVFRVVFFLPSIISSLVFVQAYKNLFMPFGPLDSLLESVFNTRLPSGIFTKPATATPAILGYTVWTGLGMNMILFQGAMKRVPGEVLEACEIDGGTWLHELFLILTPMVWGTVSMMIILAFTGLFNSGGPILLFTSLTDKTGIQNQTVTLAFYIWNNTLAGGTGLEYTAAIGVFFTLVSIPIVIIIRAILNRIDPEVEY